MGNTDTHTVILSNNPQQSGDPEPVCAEAPVAGLTANCN
jgi:hypothetical protein